MKVQISKLWNKGLGTELCALSTFLHLGVNHIQSDNKLFIQRLKNFKNFFNIQNLIIEDTDNITDHIMPSDFFKIFSPYYKKERKNLSRRYIGLSMYSDSFLLFDNKDILNNDDHLKYPKYKSYPIEQYAEIFEIIKRAGYDVITFDNKNILTIDKMHLIENFCECVIGYEGGIAHLCHMLNVPYIMLPWRIDINNDIRELLHLDEKTYFLKSINEFLNCKNNEKKYLNDLIYELNQDNGNNIFLNNDNKLYINENFEIFKSNGDLIHTEISPEEKQFFRLHKDKFKNSLVSIP